MCFLVVFQDKLNNGLDTTHTFKGSVDLPEHVFVIRLAETR